MRFHLIFLSIFLIFFNFSLVYGKNSSEVVSKSQGKLREPLVVHAEPMLRLDHGAQSLRFSPLGRYVAYLAQLGQKSQALKVLDLRSLKSWTVSDRVVSNDFVWSPVDGQRLFFRGFQGAGVGQGSSQVEVLAADVFQGKVKGLGAFDGAGSFLTFNPKDLRLYFLRPQGLAVARLVYASHRIASWQSRRARPGWVVTERKVLLAQPGGQLIPMEDDGSGVEHFSISADAQEIAWATREHRLYRARDARVIFLGYGSDPAFHPRKRWLIYAGHRMMGQTKGRLNLRILDEQNRGFWLTTTQAGQDRWPTWHPSGAWLIYGREQSTDLFRLTLDTQSTLGRKSSF